MTDAERCLWQRLRSRQLEGCKFRRQEVIEPYIVDFVCYGPKLIVELDGGQHLEQAEYDAKRTAYLESYGYSVRRYWNNDVLLNTDSVLEDIRCYLLLMK